MPRKPCCSASLNIWVNQQVITFCKICGDRLSLFADNPPTLTHNPSVTPSTYQPPKLQRMNSVHDAADFVAALRPEVLSPHKLHRYSDGSGAIPEGMVPVSTAGLKGANVPIDLLSSSHPLPVLDAHSILVKCRKKYGVTVYQKITVENGIQVIRYFKVELNGMHTEIKEGI